MGEGGSKVVTLYVCTAGKAPARYSLDEHAPLPGLTDARLSAAGFFRRSRAYTGWTDAAALQALDRFSREATLPFRIDRAFADPLAASPHGSGVSFDLGRHLPFRIQQALRTRAVKSGLFYRVQPEALCPDCVHIDCLPRPVLQEGDSGVFVFWLQALLQSLCLYHDVCTGTFQSETRRAVLRFQRICCQPCTGVADERLWRALGR